MVTGWKAFRQERSNGTGSSLPIRVVAQDSKHHPEGLDSPELGLATKGSAILGDIRPPHLQLFGSSIGVGTQKQGIAGQNGPQLVAALDLDHERNDGRSRREGRQMETKTSCRLGHRLCSQRTAGGEGSIEL